jgi:Rieske Fe-S protein
MSRRSLLSGAVVAAVAGVAGYVVAAQSALARSSPTTGGANGYGTPPPSSGGKRLIAVARVPAGGGVVLAQDGVVVTRSRTGAVHGFSSICTHQGCTLASVQGGDIVCPCHGSRFNYLTGTVANGPATRPLPVVAVTERNGYVVTA